MDKLKLFWKKNAPLIVGSVAVVVVGGAVGYVAYRNTYIRAQWAVGMNDQTGEPEGWIKIVRMNGQETFFNKVLTQDEIAARIKDLQALVEKTK